MKVYGEIPVNLQRRTSSLSPYIRASATLLTTVGTLQRRPTPGTRHLRTCHAVLMDEYVHYFSGRRARMWKWRGEDRRRTVTHAPHLHPRSRRWSFHCRSRWMTYFMDGLLQQCGKPSMKYVIVHAVGCCIRHSCPVNDAVAMFGGGQLALTAPTPSGRMQTVVILRSVELKQW